MDVMGQVDGPPTRVGIAVTDYLAGLCDAGHPPRDDRSPTDRPGPQVDIALLDSLMSALAAVRHVSLRPARAPHRMGNDHPSIAPHETLAARDGMIIVAAGNPRLWEQLCRALGAEPLTRDPRFSQHRPPRAPRRVEGRTGAVSPARAARGGDRAAARATCRAAACAHHRRGARGSATARAR